MKHLAFLCLACSCLYTACTLAVAAEADRNFDLLPHTSVEHNNSFSESEKDDKVNAAHTKAMKVGRSTLSQNMQRKLTVLRKRQADLQENLQTATTLQLGWNEASELQHLADIQANVAKTSKLIAFTEREMLRIPSYQPVEAQGTPEDLINWISQAAINSDSDKLTPLIDPYDGGISSGAICYIGSFPEPLRAEKYERLEDLRILSEEAGNRDGRLAVNVANTEDAFTIHLVQRGEFWYLD